VPTDPVVDWLLDGDPAIRWQALRDLADAPPDRVAAERARVAHEGWGARLLAVQDDDATWGGGLYSPKWTSTTYTLLLLAWLGLPAGHPGAVAGCRRLWDGARFYDGGLNLAVTVRQAETCITGMLVYLAATFGHADPRVRPTVVWLLGQQLGDGGWNCESIRSGSTHGSFHTTITVLEALAAVGGTPAGSGLEDEVAAAAARGREFLLLHRLYRSHRTGEVADPALLAWRFPPQWHYDVLRGLDHLRAVGAPADERMADALDVVRAARRADGRWAHRSPHPGRMWFALEGRGPSRWHTLRARRVLQRYAASGSH
jgi:hypothetical protein